METETEYKRYVTGSYEEIQKYKEQFPDRFDKFVDRIREYLDRQPLYRPVPINKMFSKENMETGIKALCLIYLVDNSRLGGKYIGFTDDYNAVKVYPPVQRTRSRIKSKD